MNPTDPQPLTMRARTPEDLLAMVPVLLGFIPTESVTMLTFGPHRMHARVDLPHAATEIPVVVDALLRPCLQHGVERVALLLHAVDAEPAESCALLARETFEAEGIEVVEMLRADGRRWFPVNATSGGGGVGVAYDVSAHPFVVQAVLRGEIVFGSREQLAQSLDPDPARVGAVEALIDDIGTPPTTTQMEWLSASILRWLTEGRTPSDADLARLLPVLACPSGRDTAWRSLTRESATDHVQLWTQALVAAPASLRSVPAALLAFSAWLAGNGALAWCAVDVVDPAEPDQTIADVVRALLEQAVPPSSWDRLREEPSATRSN